MKILGIDSSGMVAGVAIVTDEVTVAEYEVDYKKTHSQTLMPMLDEIVRMTEQSMEDIDAIAVAAGPGSFTGLRIGAATAKGLAMALDIPIVEVPTCRALAYNLWGFGGIVCPIMDARRSQVYTGIYSYTDGTQVTVMEQTAMSIEELADCLDEMVTDAPVVFTGDGVSVYRQRLDELLDIPHLYAPVHMARQRAASVAALGGLLFGEGRIVSADDMKPVYLRKSQAEREREAKLSADSEGE